MPCDWAKFIIVMDLLIYKNIYIVLKNENRKNVKNKTLYICMYININTGSI